MTITSRGQEDIQPTAITGPIDIEIGHLSRSRWIPPWKSAIEAGGNRQRDARIPTGRYRSLSSAAPATVLPWKRRILVEVRSQREGSDRAGGEPRWLRRIAPDQRFAQAMNDLRAGPPRKVPSGSVRL